MIYLPVFCLLIVTASPGSNQKRGSRAVYVLIVAGILPPDWEKTTSRIRAPTLTSSGNPCRFRLFTHYPPPLLLNAHCRIYLSVLLTSLCTFLHPLDEHQLPVSSLLRESLSWLCRTRGMLRGFRACFFGAHGRSWASGYVPLFILQFGLLLCFSVSRYRSAVMGSFFTLRRPQSLESMLFSVV